MFQDKNTRRLKELVRRPALFERPAKLQPSRSVRATPVNICLHFVSWLPKHVMDKLRAFVEQTSQHSEVRPRRAIPVRPRFGQLEPLFRKFVAFEVRPASPGARQFLQMRGESVDLGVLPGALAVSGPGVVGLGPRPPKWG